LYPSNSAASWRRFKTYHILRRKIERREEREEKRGKRRVRREKSEKRRARREEREEKSEKSEKREDTCSAMGVLPSLHRFENSNSILNKCDQ
jgi:hypothetical protein